MSSVRVEVNDLFANLTKSGTEETRFSIPNLVNPAT